MKCVIFCVNYNSYSSLYNYLDSLEKALIMVQSTIELVVLICDNSKIVKKVDGEYGFEIKHFPSGNNLGYFGGISYVIKKEQRYIETADYIIFSNVDLLVEKDFFMNLMTQTFPDNIGCVAPSIYSLKEKKDRNPKILKRPTRKKLAFQIYMYKYPFIYNLYVAFLYSVRRKKLQNRDEEIIYAAHGSFIIFTSYAKKFLRSMEYKAFLFGEEIFVAENLMRLNLQTIYIPSLKVIDDDHISTGKMKSSSFFKNNYKSLSILKEEYFNE